MTQNQPVNSEDHVTFVVFGASGDLAKKKTFPAIFDLYWNDFLHRNWHAVGYARSELAQDDFKGRLKGHLKGGTKTNTAEKFLERCSYVSGGYDDQKGYLRLKEHLEELEKPFKTRNRVFYLATPPTVFADVAALIRKVLHPEDDYKYGWFRLVVEKPFGKDLESSRKLVKNISDYWPERLVYRIDHYLGKEMVKSLLTLRFANIFFGAIWNRHYISNVQITFKEAFGAEGRGGYFDEYGMIRDVMQNHLLQVLTAVAMEKPISLNEQDIRDEKVKVLRSSQKLKLEDTLLGQYVESLDGKKKGYTSDETVPDDSLTCTFAATTIYIDNERWYGVPFILRCGKALNETKTEIRIQFSDCPGNIFNHELARNELVIRVQPEEAVYAKVMNKVPGLTMKPHISELDLSYSTRYADVRIPAAYEALLIDVINGDQSNFVRSDELDAAWSLFTPLLHAIDEQKVVPEKYPYGARAPESLNKWLEERGVQHSNLSYDWKPRSVANSPTKL